MDTFFVSFQTVVIIVTLLFLDAASLRWLKSTTDYFLFHCEGLPAFSKHWKTMNYMLLEAPVWKIRMISYQGHMFLIYQRNIKQDWPHFPPPSCLPSQAQTRNQTLTWTAQNYFDGLSILTNVFQSFDGSHTILMSLHHVNAWPNMSLIETFCVLISKNGWQNTENWSLDKSVGEASVYAVHSFS